MNAWIHASKWERRAIRWLLTLMVISQLSRWWLNEWNKQRAVWATPNIHCLENEEQYQSAHIHSPFNPNQAADSIWLSFGISERGVQSIRKYITKGGVFRKEQDVAKMYCIDSMAFQRMRPFLLFDSSPANHHQEEHNTHRSPWQKRASMARIELNSADTLELQRLPAIGRSIARRIILYRDRLGGYHQLDQLLEVYRMTPGKLDTIQPFLVLDPTLIRRIPINTISAQDLGKHPYIAPSQARALVAYREKHGAFRHASDLLGCLAMDEETVNQLSPYLSFD